MATYYARNVTGNWAANTSWDSASSGGAGPAGPPVAGDTAIFDSGFTGSITIAAAAACAILTCQAGATGSLTFGAVGTLTTTGNITFVSGFSIVNSGGDLYMNGSGATLTGNGVTGAPRLLRVTANVTLDINGTTFNTVYHAAGPHTITLASDLQCSSLDFSANYGSTTVAGAFNITCDYFYFGTVYSMPLTLVSGQTLTVNTGLYINRVATYVPTIKSSTSSSETFLHYNGLQANCLVNGAIFTDVNCAHAIDNWYGGTLTRCTGITNRTSADIGGGGVNMPRTRIGH